MSLFLPEALPADIAEGMTQREAEVRFRSLYDAHHRSVARALAYYGVSSADQPDLVQEVFLSVHSSLLRGKHPPHDAPPSVWRSWLRQFARRHAANCRRSAHDETELLELASRAAAADPERVTARRELLALLLDKLDPESREIFLDVNAEGMSWQQIADERSITIDRARYLLRRAVERMESAMARWEKHEREPAVVPVSVADLLTVVPPFADITGERSGRLLESLARRRGAGTLPRDGKGWVQLAVALPSHAGVLALGGILGWALHGSPKELSSTAPLSPSRSVEARASAVTSPASRETVSSEAPVATTAPQIAPSVSVAPRSSAPERRPSGALKDGQLLDQAQAALIAGDAHAALAALSKRDGRFAEGPSASVRQRLLVRACALPGGRAAAPCAEVLAAKGR